MGAGTRGMMDGFVATQPSAFDSGTYSGPEVAAAQCGLSRGKDNGGHRKLGKIARGTCKVGCEGGNAVTSSNGEGSDFVCVKEKGAKDVSCACLVCLRKVR